MSDDRVLVSHINLARGYRGGERQTQLLLEGLAARGWRQRLVARKGEPLALRCKSIPGLEVIEVRANLVSAVLVLGDVGLVHVHEGRSIKAAYLNSIFRGIGYMVTRRVQTGPRHSRLNHLMYRRSSAVVAISAAIYRSLVEMQSNLEVLQIPSATSELSADPNRIKAIRERFGNEILVGHIGALDDSHKGQLQIIALAKMLNDQAPQVSFVLVGSGRDEALLKREAAGLENVHFVGQVEIDNVGDYLAAFDMFIFPSRHEGLGSILLDALAFGLPVLATRVGGIPEIIEDGKNGFLCPVDDIAAYYRWILDLCQDSELREKISLANKKKAAQYSPAQMTDRYVEVYERLLKNQDSQRATV